MSDVLRLLTGGTRRPAKPVDSTPTVLPRKKSKVHSNYPADPLPNYDEESALPTPLRKSMVTLGYLEPTEIQRHLIPALLNRQDVVATAETGSGKTFAFLLPIFALLDPKTSVGAVIVAPTRELATQTVAEACRFLQVCSRKFSVAFLDKKAKSVGVLVATPLRLLQALNSSEISLQNTEIFVLDEADKLLDLGFLPQLDSLLSYYKAELMRRRTAGDERCLNLVLVSATLPEKVVSLATACMGDATRITVGHVQAANRNIQQELVFTGSEDGKIPMLRQMAKSGALKPPCIVFVESKDRAMELTNELLFDGLMVDAVHAGRSNFERDRTIAAFRAGTIWILVATDVLGRGVDFTNVQQVINFDVPKTAATYIHRIGRTGRAGRTGHAVTLFTEADVQVMKPVVNVMRESMVEVPEWLVKALPKKRKQNNMPANPEYTNKKRRTIDTSVREKIHVSL